MHGCVVKVINWELYKWLKFDYANKWHKPESVQEKRDG